MLLDRGHGDRPRSLPLSTLVEVDDALLDVVLERLGQHPLDTRPEELLLAALEGADILAGVMGGKARPRPSPDRERPRADAVAAYLSRLTVTAFRGIGSAATLSLVPGPGLTLVVGRNGSGKSSFAEALELLVTGALRRWTDRSAVWRDGWRNLHVPDDPVIEAGLLIEGTNGPALLRRAWSADDKLGDATTVVRLPGEPESGPDRLGWADALDSHRPFLSHSELESMLGQPSELYDLLVAVLGLDDLTQASQRLATAARDAVGPLDEAKKELPTLLDDLRALGDERADAAADALTTEPWDLASASAVATGVHAAEAGSEIDALRSIVNLASPDAETVLGAVEGLRSAAEGLDAVVGTQAERARRLADLLQVALDHHHTTGDGPCPVCGRPDALDDAWRSATEAEVARLRSEATAAEKATRTANEARTQAFGLLSQAPAVLDQPVVGLDPVALRTAWRAWAETPPADGVDGLRALATHVEERLPELQDTCDAFRDQAKAALAEREDRWSPLASRVAAWCEAAGPAVTTASLVPDLRSAGTWLKGAIDDLRNRRLTPLAMRSAEVWEKLRQESNVELGAIRLKGTGNRREVDFEVTVDGEAGTGLGVMSQGEVNALALSVFLPRATLPTSPFRFLVIDDPVQAMDPAKVEGLARVLCETAGDRQVIVFTHDDRLPEAVRRLMLPASILEVTRRPGSVVEVRPGLDPAGRAFDDALALVKDPNVPDVIARRVVAGLCRLAIEATFSELVRRRRLGRGDSHADVEDALLGATTLNKKAALALFDDPERTGDVYGALGHLRSRHPVDTYKAVNKGAHGGYPGDLDTLIRDVRDLVAQVRAKIT